MYWPVIRQREEVIHIYWKKSFFNFSNCPFESCWLYLKLSTHWHLNKNSFHMSHFSNAHCTAIQVLLVSSNPTFKLLSQLHMQHRNHFISHWLTGAPCPMVCIMYDLLLLHCWISVIAIAKLVTDCIASHLNHSNKTLVFHLKVSLLSSFVNFIFVFFYGIALLIAIKDHHCLCANRLGLSQVYQRTM